MFQSWNNFPGVYSSEPLFQTCRDDSFIADFDFTKGGLDVRKQKDALCETPDKALSDGRHLGDTDTRIEGHMPLDHVE